MVFFLIGCSSGNDEAQGEDGLIIGFSQHRMAGSDWYNMLIEGARYQAEKQGVTLLFTDAGGDAVQQNSDVQNMLTRGAKGIVLNALDPRGMAGTIAELDDEGIPIVTVNSRISEDLEQMTYGFVAEDQLATAAQAGEELARLLASKFSTDEKVKIAVVGGYSGESTTAMRQEGFETGFFSYLDNNPGPEVELLPTRYGEWLPDRAREPIQQIATANPDIKAVFSMSDVMYPGIEQGLREAGILDDVIIVSYDGAMGLVARMMEEPNGPLQATVSNTPFIQGAKAVQTLIDAINGEDYLTKGGLLFTDSVLITPENAAEYYDADKPYYYSEEALEELSK